MTPDPVPPVGQTFDLDAARQARYEKQGPAPGITILGERFEIPRSIPLDILDTFDFDEDTDALKLNPRDLGRLLEAVIGADTLTEIRTRTRLDLDDLMDLVPGLLTLYGLTLGESDASGDSSGDTGRPSRPTSPGSTESTSPTRSTAPRRRRSAASAG